MLKVCGERWADTGKKNAVLMTRERLFAWRSTPWWKHKSIEYEDAKNHKSWKHKWDWHNWGCVWSKIPSEWSGEEEWGTKRRRCQCEADKWDLVDVKHPVKHRPGVGEEIKAQKKEDPMRTARTATASWKK